MWESHMSEWLDLTCCECDKDNQCGQADLTFQLHIQHGNYTKDSVQQSFKALHNGISD